MFQLNIHWYRFENLITSSSSLKILFEEIFKRFFDLSLLKYLLSISSNNIFSDRHNPDRVIFNLSSSSYENNIIISLYMLSWKQCALPVITTMALWQLMHLGTWCTLIYRPIETGRGDWGASAPPWFLLIFMNWKKSIKVKNNTKLQN